MTRSWTGNEAAFLMNRLKVWKTAFQAFGRVAPKLLHASGEAHKSGCQRTCSQKDLARPLK